MGYKVVVIDDKPLIRRALVETIPWEKYDCQVAGEADNGLAAKALIEKTGPELIISDIKMPGMDGLELTEYVKEILPKTKVIIITGYQEFDYAKRALTLGVCDLVLKPIQNATMEKTIAKVLALIKQEQRTEEELSRSEKSRQVYFLTELIKGRIAAEDISEELLAGKGLCNGNIMVVIARMRCGDEKKRQEEKDRIVSGMAVFEKNSDYKIMELLTGEDMTFVIFERTEKSARERRIIWKRYLEEMNEKIKGEFGDRCCFAVSRTINDVRNLAQCYRAISDMLERNYFTASANVLFMDSYTLTPDVDEQFILQKLDRFCERFKTMGADELEKELEELVDCVVKETEGDEFRIKCFLCEICITLLRQCNSREAEKEDAGRIMEEINALTDVRLSCRYLFQFACRIREYERTEPSKENPLVSGALAYINEHYKENISLTQMAESLSANASYLSRLLKQETGKNFVDILSEYRVEKAKRLLSIPGSKAAEVCVQVGYKDYTYFYQVFKRLENISPSEYKKLVKKTNIL